MMLSTMSARILFREVLILAGDHGSETGAQSLPVFETRRVGGRT